MLNRWELVIVLGLLGHVVSDKYVDVDFKNVNVELSKKVVSKNVRHVDMSIFKNI
jgi:hypothetical protein